MAFDLLIYHILYMLITVTYDAVKFLGAHTYVSFVIVEGLKLGTSLTLICQKLIICVYALF